MWHVSSRSGVATLRTAIHLLHSYITVERCRHERHAARRDQYRQRPAQWPLPRIEALVTGATCPLQLSVCLSRVPSQQTTQRVQKRLLLSTNKKCAEQLTDAIHCTLYRIFIIPVSARGNNSDARLFSFFLCLLHFYNNKVQKSRSCIVLVISA